MAIKKKLKYPPTNANPKITPGTGGEGAKVKRNKKGELEGTKGKNYYDTPEMQANRKKTRAKASDKTFAGAPAPRVGGKQRVIAPSGPLKSATKKVIRQSRRKPTGSPQARRSQKNNRF